MKGTSLEVSAKQVNEAKRLMSVSALESIRLIHVRAADMTAIGNPVRNLEEKDRPSVSFDLIGEGQFRVIVEHMVVARQGSESGPPEIQIDAGFELVYSVPADTKPNLAELQAFAETNTLLNCWPYWRELVQNMVGRMNLRPLILPLFRLQPEIAEKDKQSKPRAAE